MARSKKGRGGGAHHRGSSRGAGGVAMQVLHEKRNNNLASSILNYANRRQNHDNRGTDLAARKKNEHAFFNKFFGNEPQLLEEYNRRMSKAPDGIIDWDFLPNVHRNPINSKQYCRALYFVRNRLESARIDHFDELQDLQNLSQKVLAMREKDLANHRNVCDLWKGISDTIDQKQAEINFLNARIQTVDPKSEKTEGDEDRRGSSRNFLIRLFCCCCS